MLRKYWKDIFLGEIEKNISFRKIRKKKSLNRDECLLQFNVISYFKKLQNIITFKKNLRSIKM